MSLPSTRLFRAAVVALGAAAALSLVAVPAQASRINWSCGSDDDPMAANDQTYQLLDRNGPAYLWAAFIGSRYDVWTTVHGNRGDWAITDWSDDGDNNWHSCGAPVGAVHVNSSPGRAWTDATNWVDGRDFRGAATLNGTMYRTAWAHIAAPR